ncbi:hypothetical protein DPMN_055820 [Dreissena polymorpha]|uniref:Uncharacterized protein n=1 Tax=Dreissena polymorpha TaxID=45954 RepID=A0A9D4CRF4_DREPO|nr:hypothetical protein DPMN_055820 [Dreissena polymorpha]
MAPDDRQLSTDASGNYNQALETYKYIHRRFPDNVECLKFLVRICSDLGLK